MKVTWEGLASVLCAGLSLVLSGISRKFQFFTTYCFVWSFNWKRCLPCKTVSQAVSSQCLGSGNFSSHEVEYLGTDQERSIILAGLRRVLSMSAAKAHSSCLLDMARVWECYRQAANEEHGWEGKKRECRRRIFFWHANVGSRGLTSGTGSSGTPLTGRRGRWSCWGSTSRGTTRPSCGPLSGT